MQFKDRIFELRKAAGLSQAELAKKLYVADTYICLWETGRRVPSVEVMKDIAKFFDVSLDYLSGLTDRKKFDESA